MEITCIDNESNFEMLAGDWNRLAGLTAPDSVFLRHEWFDAAWAWLKKECQMAILVVYKDRCLVGICPLVVREKRYRGVSIRDLEFMSVPDTQYCDVLAEPGERSGVISAIFEYLCSQELKWDRMELDKLGAASNIVSLFPESARRASLIVNILENDTNPGISLSQTWEEFYSHRSRRLKKGNNHVANRIRRDGKQATLTHLTVDKTDLQDVPDLLKIATDLSSRSWKQTTGLTLDNPGPSAFIRRLTEHAIANGWLSFWLLQYDDIPVAMEYQLVYDGVISALRADYDLAFEDLSPGTYMNWKMLEQLFNGKYRMYCMGPGGNKYKFRWAEEFPVQYRLTLYNNSVRGRILGLIFARLMPLAKSITRKVKRMNKNMD